MAASTKSLQDPVTGRWMCYICDKNYAHERSVVSHQRKVHKRWLGEQKRCPAEVEAKDSDANAADMETSSHSKDGSHSPEPCLPYSLDSVLSTLFSIAPAPAPAPPEDPSTMIAADERFAMRVDDGDKTSQPFMGASEAVANPNPPVVDVPPTITEPEGLVNMAMDVCNPSSLQSTVGSDRSPVDLDVPECCTASAGATESASACVEQTKKKKKKKKQIFESTVTTERDADSGCLESEAEIAVDPNLAIC
jgi:hypothetical protein